MDEAKEIFSQAANCYKIAQQWDRAVECYLKCVECEGNDGSGASYYLEAAHCIKKVNSHKFLEFANKAINAYCLDQRISSAASLAKECAEKLEDDADFEKAIEYYEKMAELYLTDEQPTSANQALVKVADLIVLTRNYSLLAKAIKVRICQAYVIIEL